LAYTLIGDIALSFGIRHGVFLPTLIPKDWVKSYSFIVER